MAKISIIVPVYNAEETLIRCIDSILSQTYYDLDIVLIDDGSTDRSGEICDIYALLDKRICVFHTCNQGLSAARNYGIDIALSHGSSYLAFIDSDDYLESDFYTKLYLAIKDNSADVSCCGYYCEENGKSIAITAPDQVYTTGKALDALIEKAIETTVWNKLYRIHLFEVLRFPNNRVYEDVSTCYRIMLLADKVVCISYTGYHHVIRNDGITHTVCMRNLADYWMAYRERYEFFSKDYPGLLDSQHIDILARGAVFAAFRVWRWALHCDANDRDAFAWLFNDISFSIKNDFRDVNIAKWPLYLKVSFLIIHNSSILALSLSCFSNQVYSILRTVKQGVIETSLK